jgi:ubiquinone/menaquinone biosynthesis C-methylase UbiE
MGRPWLFDLSAFLYGVMTAQQTWRSSCARLADFFPSHDDSPRPLRVLDLGCGPGVSTIILAEVRPSAHLFGLDLAPRMLGEAIRFTDRARLDGRIGYVLADAQQLPFADSSWDMITGHSFLYLVPNRRRVVAEAFRVLERGGRIASMEPRRGGFHFGMLLKHWREVRFLISVILWRPYSSLHGQLSPDSFSELLKSAGFVNYQQELVLDGAGIIGSGEKP